METGHDDDRSRKEEGSGQQQGERQLEHRGEGFSLVNLAEYDGSSGTRVHTTDSLPLHPIFVFGDTVRDATNKDPFATKCVRIVGANLWSVGVIFVQSRQ